MKINLSSTYRTMRRQPVLSIVTIVGTALAIFLVMVVVMLNEISISPYAPESGRDRFLHNTYTSIVTEDEEYQSNGPMSYETFKRIFGDMETPEAVTAYRNMTEYSLANVQGEPPVTVDRRDTDDRFWDVFDFTFVAGAPYDKASFDAGLSQAVVSENTARAIFGSTDVVGREMLLNHVPYKVVGIVKDVSPLAHHSYAQVWVPFTSTGTISTLWNNGTMGLISATILAADRDDLGKIRDEYNRKLAEYNSSMKEFGWRIVSRNRPYDQETENAGMWANNEPDVDGKRLQRLIIYLILLIVPAINLSSMTESRLRRRMSEIGVRRAFGCSRPTLLGEIIAENLAITLVAGLIGFLLSVAFAFIAQRWLFPYTDTGGIPAAPVNATMLLHWSTFGWAFGMCFLLNLLSAGIPAIKASRLNIVNAIQGLRK